MVKEQFNNSCTLNLSVHLRERAPTTLDDLAKYAEHFLIAHNRQLASKVFPNVNSPVYIPRSQSNYSRVPEGQNRCHKCSQLGHIAPNCKVKVTQGQSQNQSQSLKHCYSCGKPGHDARACKFRTDNKQDKGRSPAMQRAACADSKSGSVDCSAGLVDKVGPKLILNGIAEQDFV